MSQAITLELPDVIYQKFKVRSLQNKRSVEEELLTAFALDVPVLPVANIGEMQAYNEVIDFLLSSPSPSEVVKFKLSEHAQKRAKALLQKQNMQNLTPAEEKELDFYVELGDFLGILRAKAQIQTQDNIKL